MEVKSVENIDIPLFYHDARIRDAVYNYKFTDDKRHERIEQLVRALQRLFAEMQHTPWDAAETTDFCGLLELNQEQQDMQEFFQLFSQLCDKLLEPCVDGHYLKRLLSDQFESRMQSSRKCTKCGHIVYSEETIRDLLLPLQPGSGQLRVEDMIGAYLFQGEPLEVRCPKCDGTNAEKQLHFLRPADTICIRFTRETFSATSSTAVKNRRAVYYPNWFDMTPFIEPKHKPKLAKERQYELVAVFCHTGSFSHGHYWAILKDPSAKWWNYNDTKVRSTKAPGLSHDSPDEAESAASDDDAVDLSKPGGTSAPGAAKKHSSNKSGGSGKKPPTGTAYTECYMLAYRVVSARRPDVPCPQFLLDTVAAKLEDEFETTVMRKNRDLCELLDAFEKRSAELQAISYALQVDKEEGMPDMSKLSVFPTSVLQEVNKIECGLFEQKLAAVTAEQAESEAKLAKLEDFPGDAVAASGGMAVEHAAEALKSVGNVLTQKTGSQVLCPHGKVRPSDLTGGQWRIVSAAGLAQFVDFYKLKILSGGHPPTLLSMLCGPCDTDTTRSPLGSSKEKLAEINKLAKQLRRYSKSGQLPSAENKRDYVYVSADAIKQYLDLVRDKCRKGSEDQSDEATVDAVIVPFLSSVDHDAGGEEAVAGPSNGCRKIDCSLLDESDENNDCSMDKIICSHGGLSPDASKCYLIECEQFERISEMLQFDKKWRLCGDVSEPCVLCIELREKLREEQRLHEERRESLSDRLAPLIQETKHKLLPLPRAQTFDLVCTEFVRQLIQFIDSDGPLPSSVCNKCHMCPVHDGRIVVPLGRGGDSDDMAESCWRRCSTSAWQAVADILGADVELRLTTGDDGNIIDGPTVCEAECLEKAYNDWLNDTYTYTNAVISAAVVEERPTAENQLAHICDSTVAPVTAKTRTRKRRAAVLAEAANTITSKGAAVKDIVRLENVSSESTVINIKTRLYERTGITPVDINVYWKRGVLLDRNDMTLGQAKIPAGATLLVKLDIATAATRKQAREEMNRARDNAPKESFGTTGLALR